jgi:hypothetical protein
MASRPASQGYGWIDAAVHSALCHAEHVGDFCLAT